MPARQTAALAAVLLATAAGCGSSGTDHDPLTVVQTVTGKLPPPLQPSTAAAPSPAPSNGGGDSTSQSSAGTSEGAFAMQGRDAVRFTYQGFQYKMEMQTAHLDVDGEDVTLGTPAPHGNVWVVALFTVSNVDDRPVPAIDSLLVPDTKVRERYARDADRREAVSVDDDNCQQDWCGVHDAVASGVIEEGQFNATPCATCTMGIGSSHQIKAAYQVREGLEPDDIRFFMPELAPLGGDYSRASRRLG